VEAVVGTLVGRWYVTIFGVAFFWFASRHLGWRKTLTYFGVSMVVGLAFENGSVHWGFPYTHYQFNENLRGDELWAWDVPLMVPLSYSFMGYFAFAFGRLLASGPRRTRGNAIAEYGLGVMLAVWALWILDPVSRLGDEFYLGRVFAYDGPGFWFGLPLGSQLGFTLTAVILVGVLAWLSRDEGNRIVEGLRHHPHLPALLTYHGQVFHLAIVAMVVGAHDIGGAAFLMWVPAAAITAVQWSSAAKPQAFYEMDQPRATSGSHRG
jgi:putative membrane protein